MPTFLPGIIMGFREGLEAFLIITMILHYLSKISQTILFSSLCQYFGGSFLW